MVHPPTECEHENERAAQRKIGRNIHHGFQCLECGRWRNIPKNGRPDILPWYDETIVEAYKLRLDAWFKQQLEEDRRRTEEKRREWNRLYDEFRTTNRWKNRRKKVLERENYLCECCRKRRACQAHHTTYEHAYVLNGGFVDVTPLWKLKAVCRECHRFLHDKGIK